MVEIISDWIRRANNDLISARYLFEDLRPKQTEISAFHCRQCAEKALKAFLVFNNSNPLKIHDLNKLCELCRTIDSSFSEIEIDCAKINPYSIKICYPNELIIDEPIVVVASTIERAEKVYNFCITKITV